MENLILRSDSYKASHFKQYPEDAEGYFGYIESRGGEYDRTVFFGLQIFLKRYLAKPITQEMIDTADAFFNLHGEPFNREGWEYILNTYGGYIPVVIKAVPEGMVIPTRNVLVTVQCNDPKCFWVGSFIETQLLRAIWYPVTVATNSYQCKQIIKKYLDETSDDPEGQINFKLHDFGARGVSSAESAEIGGAAHLVNFMGSDTVEGVYCMNTIYNNGKMSAFSIPAAEHSTVTCWGKDNEVDAYRNMLKQYAKPGSLVAVVSDSYDIFNAVENMWGGVLKQEVIDSGATIVIRPDSGDPETVVCKVVELLADKFGYTINNKGYKVLNNVRVIQGDGVNKTSIRDILANLALRKFSADNIAFGMGGALLQANITRDTYQFAMKCSAIKRNGKWIGVSKNPITDNGKASKAGLLSLYYDKRDEHYITIAKSYEDEIVIGMTEILEVVFDSGKIIKEYTLDEIRLNVNK